MKDTETYSLPRRDFLRGTAMVLGAAALGLEAAQARAISHPQSTAPISIAYWTGTRLVDARNLSTDTELLSSVRLTVHGHHGGEALRAINAHFQVDGASGVPFHAWTAAAHGSPDSRFTMPVTPGDGLLLSILSETETFCRLRTDAALNQPKLRPGCYIIALGEPAWLGCHFDPEAMRGPSGPLSQRTLGGFVPARFGYRVVTVEQA